MKGRQWEVALLTDAQLRQPGRVEVVVAASGAHKHVGSQLVATCQHCSGAVGGAAVVNVNVAEASKQRARWRYRW
jgi:hypothetical protein